MYRLTVEHRRLCTARGVCAHRKALQMSDGIKRGLFFYSNVWHSLSAGSQLHAISSFSTIVPSISYVLFISLVGIFYANMGARSRIMRCTRKSPRKISIEFHACSFWFYVVQQQIRQAKQHSCFLAASFGDSSGWLKAFLWIRFTFPTILKLECIRVLLNSGVIY